MLSMIANPVTALPVGYPRSGLSRSDLVRWPQTDVPIALAHVCFEGEERKWRGLAAMSLNDPGCVKTGCFMRFSQR